MARIAARTKAPTMTKGARVSMVDILFLSSQMKHLCPGAVEIGSHPGMFRCQDRRQRPDGGDLAVGKGCDPVADGGERVEVMRDHEDREAECSLQRPDQ